MASDRIRILHILHAFSAGGLENGIVNIINHSPDHLEHELCLLTRGGEFLKRLARPIPVHELHKREGNDLRALGRLCQLLHHKNFDIVHTRNWAAFDGVLAAITTPSVTLIHGEHGRDIQDPQGLNKRRNFLRRLAGHRIHRFVAVSSNLYEWLWKTVQIPRKKITLIHNGVDTAKFRRTSSLSLRKEFAIQDSEFVVGTVARLDPVKDHEGMIEAVRLLNQSGNNIRLIIVGEGPNRSSLEKLIRGWQDGPTPILTGYREDTLDFYGLFDVFLLTSYAEGMSNTLLEAMSCMLPVICTPVGANVEVVEHNVTGMIVPVAASAELAASISSYKGSEGMRASHAENARNFIEKNFSLNKMVNTYLNLYQSGGSCATF